MKPYMEFVREHASRERDVFLDLVREPHLLVPTLNRTDAQEEGASFLTVRFKPRGPGASKDDVQGVVMSMRLPRAAGRRRRVGGSRSCPPRWP